jgi:hypothetical protein
MHHLRRNPARTAQRAIPTNLGHSKETLNKAKLSNFNNY